MIRDLVELAVNMVRGEKTRTVEERAREMAEERLLDLLLPPARPGGFGAAHESGAAQETREKLRARLRDGALDERTVEIEVAQRSLPMIDLMGGHGMEEMQDNLKEMLGNLLPQRTRRRKVKVHEARRILTRKRRTNWSTRRRSPARRSRASRIRASSFWTRWTRSPDGKGARAGRVARRRAAGPAAHRGRLHGEHEVRPGADRPHPVHRRGRLSRREAVGPHPRAAGRFPLRVELTSLTERDFVRILTEPENALTKQYTALLATEGVELAFTPDAVEEIARIATTVNEATENIGARRLYTIMERLLDEVSFEAPHMEGVRVEITGDQVRKQLTSIVTNQDLSRYIL